MALAEHWREATLCPLLEQAELPGTRDFFGSWLVCPDSGAAFYCGYSDQDAFRTADMPLAGSSNFLLAAVTGPETGRLYSATNNPPRPTQ